MDAKEKDAAVGKVVVSFVAKSSTVKVVCKFGNKLRNFNFGCKMLCFSACSRPWKRLTSKILKICKL